VVNSRIIQLISTRIDFRQVILMIPVPVRYHLADRHFLLSRSKYGSSWQRAAWLIPAQIRYQLAKRPYVWFNRRH